MASRRDIVNNQKTAIIEVLQDHKEGITVLDMIDPLADRLGYQLSRFVIRDRLVDLMEMKLVHRFPLPNSAGSYAYRFGFKAEPKKVKESKKEEKQEELKLPPVKAEVAQKIHNAIDAANLQKIHDRFNTLEKKLNTLIIRSEYNTSAMIAIKKVADELGVVIPELEKTG